LAVAARSRWVVTAQRAEVDIEVRVVRLGLEAEFVGGVLAEAANVLGQVRRDVGQVLGVDDVALLLELPDDLGNVQGAVEDDRVREQRVEFRSLLLLDGVVVGDDAAVAEADPLGEAVERFGLVRPALRRAAADLPRSAPEHHDRDRSRDPMALPRPPSRTAHGHGKPSDSGSVA
jgi:hypothetical protein